MTQEDWLSWGNGSGSPNSHPDGGCALGSCNFALLFKKEGQQEDTCGPSIPRLRNWGKGSWMIPRVLKPHFGEEAELCQKAGRCGKSIPLKERAEFLHGHSGH